MGGRQCLLLQEPRVAEGSWDTDRHPPKDVKAGVSLWGEGLGQDAYSVGSVQS